MIQTKELILQIATITPNGRIDAFNAPELRQEINQFMDEGINHLVIDLSQVTFCDSAAMAVFVSALKRSRQTEGDVKLVWPTSPAACRIFTLTKMDRVFDMCDSAVTAQANFGAI